MTLMVLYNCLLLSKVKVAYLWQQVKTNCRENPCNDELMNGNIKKLTLKINFLKIFYLPLQSNL